MDANFKLNDTCLEQPLSFGKAMQFQEAMMAALVAMATYGSSDEHVHVVALFLARAEKEKADAFRRDERERYGKE